MSKPKQPFLISRFLAAVSEKPIDCVSGAIETITQPFDKKHLLNDIALSYFAEQFAFIKLYEESMMWIAGSGDKYRISRIIFREIMHTIANHFILCVKKRMDKVCDYVLMELKKMNVNTILTFQSFYASEMHKVCGNQQLIDTPVGDLFEQIMDMFDIVTGMQSNQWRNKTWIATESPLSDAKYDTHKRNFVVACCEYRKLWREPSSNKIALYNKYEPLIEQYMVDIMTVKIE